MTSFLKARGRALCVLVMALLAISCFIAATLIGKIIFDWYLGLIIGALLMGISIPFHILGKGSKCWYILSFLFNSVGAGFSMSTYYTVTEVYCDFGELLFSSAIPILVIAALCLILLIVPKEKHIVVAIFIIIEAILLIASIVFWIRDGGEYYAFSFFSYLVCSFYTIVCAVTVDEEERRLLRDISFGSFGIFLLVSIIVLAVASQGEACDGCDCCDCGDFSFRRKNKK